MIKHWILDREDTPQGFPLAKLITKIREVACFSGCQFVVRRSRGYGATVCHWDELLDSADELIVSPDELQRLSLGSEQWFYDLDARCVTPTETFAFGIHDSSAMFLEASEAVAEQVIRAFVDVRTE